MDTSPDPHPPGWATSPGLIWLCPYLESSRYRGTQALRSSAPGRGPSCCLESNPQSGPLLEVGVVSRGFSDSAPGPVGLENRHTPALGSPLPGRNKGVTDNGEDSSGKGRPAALSCLYKFSREVRGRPQIQPRPEQGSGSSELGL